jgi:hypothetical protein
MEEQRGGLAHHKQAPLLLHGADVVHHGGIPLLYALVEGQRVALQLAYELVLAPATHRLLAKPRRAEEGLT